MITSPIVLLAHGKACRCAASSFTLLIFAGVVVVNLAQVQHAWRDVLLGGLPVLIRRLPIPPAAQLLWEGACRSGHAHPASSTRCSMTALRVLLLTLWFRCLLAGASSR